MSYMHGCRSGENFLSYLEVILKCLNLFSPEIQWRIPVLSPPESLSLCSQLELHILSVPSLRLGLPMTLSSMHLPSSLGFSWCCFALSGFCDMWVFQGVILPFLEPLKSLILPNSRELTFFLKVPSYNPLTTTINYLWVIILTCPQELCF